MISAFWSVINGTSQAGYWSLAILSGNRRRLQGRQIEMKTSRLEIGYDTELTQGAEISGQALSEFKQTVIQLRWHNW